MPRPKKSAELSITEALDTQVEQTIEGAAANLGIDPFRLQELFVERLGTDDPMIWLTIPIEHEPLLADIHRALDQKHQSVALMLPPNPPFNFPQWQKFPNYG
jgi:hypothetical protein